MDVRITTRHFEVHRELRESIDRKLRSAIGKYYPQAIEANVIISMQKRRYVAELAIKIRRTSFHARDEARDLQAALDNVMAKLETQMRRYKEKRKRPHQKVSLD